MSILKGTHSGINAKLTPTYIVSFGYTYAEGIGKNVYIKKDKHILWDDHRKKFVFIFEYEKKDNTALSYKEKYEYTFDTYPELKILEQYWFSENEYDRKSAYDYICENSSRLFDFFNSTVSAFVKSFGGPDLVDVQPMEKPTAMINYFDFGI